MPLIMVMTGASVLEMEPLLLCLAVALTDVEQKEIHIILPCIRQQIIFVF